mgnify:CR=1 FL=1
MFVSFNIMNSSGSALNGIPILWKIDSVSEFSKAIRDNCLDIAAQGAENYSMISKMYLAVTFYEDISKEEYSENNFYIRLKNVREFKQYIKMGYEDIKVEYEIKKRNDKIEKLGL